MSTIPSSDANTIFLSPSDDIEGDYLLVIAILALLLWFFTGVALIADVFMASIERITSVKKRVQVKKTDRHATVKVWNETVANLTLMALGSSAPEIILSIIELFGNGMQAGKLGPSTIVGSAAFNLFVISAVCVYCIPSGETRKIDDTAVYAVTAAFSLFAYIWLVFILKWSSPDRIETWEGVLTFCLFPVLVGFAYAADRGMLSDRSDMGQRVVYIEASAMTADELAEKTAELRRLHGKDLSEVEITKLLNTNPPSRLDFRRRALSTMFRSGRSLRSIETEKICDVASPRSFSKEVSGGQVSITFESSRYSVMENIGKVQLPVIRTGDQTQTTRVQYTTRDGLAKSGEDYEAANAELVFAPFETVKYVDLQIIDDDVPEDTKEFYVDLSVPDDVMSPRPLLRQTTTTVLIVDDDDPGILAWEKDFNVVEESVLGGEMVEVQFEVTRQHGSAGRASCKYRTENITAVAPHDYEATQGEVFFENNQLSAFVPISIISRGRYIQYEEFRVILYEPQGASFDKETDGGVKECIKTVRIVSPLEGKQSIDKIRRMLRVDWDKNAICMEEWRDNFVEAWFVNGSKEEQQAASVLDWIIHLILLPWKLIFAFVPPPSFFDGAVCFFVSLGVIGVMTAFIGDLALLFGLACGLDDMITSITFVALGTSVPDLFASKSAAVGSENADASIGNITGSNSVNVFLGLGLPWCIASFYWACKGEVFKVKAGNLSSSVLVYCLCAIVCISVLCLRRKFLGAELGGPRFWKILTAVGFVLLWVIYIVVSICMMEERK